MTAGSKSDIPYITQSFGEYQSQHGKKTQNAAHDREAIISETVELLRDAPWNLLVFVHQYLLA